jgi:PAS domain S-box-containing protein
MASTMEKLKQFVQQKRPEVLQYVDSKPMLLADAHGTIIAINRRFSQIFGYEEADLLGRSLGVLKQGFSDEDEFTRKQIFSFQIYHLQFAESKALVVNLLHKMGYPVPVRLHSLSERGPDSRLKEIAFIVEPLESANPVTRSSAVHAGGGRIKAVEQICLNILEYSGDAIFISDLNGRVMKVNPATVACLTMLLNKIFRESIFLNLALHRKGTTPVPQGIWFPSTQLTSSDK